MADKKTKKARLPRVAVIGTGGTIASIGVGPLDITNYTANGKILKADELVARVPELALVADVYAVPFKNIPSTQLGWPEWKEMLRIGPLVAAPGCLRPVSPIFM